jgi:CBS domain containing-hemolysin-like protein
MPPISLVALWAIAAGSLVLALVLNLVASLLERSGPIRLRHWAESASPSIKALYEDSPRFLAFSCSLRVLSRLAILALVATLAYLGFRLEVAHPVAWAVLALVPLVVLTEIANQHVVGTRAEAALQHLTPVLRASRFLLEPLMTILRFFMPRSDQEEHEFDLATPEEIDAFIDVGRREGILEPAEGDLVRGLVDFGDTQVRSVMTPRVDVVAASTGTSVQDLVKLVLESGHSRIPMYRDSVDEVVGILHVRDLLRVVHDPGEHRISGLLQAPHFVPETKSLAQLLGELQERHQEIAIVVDEYGGTEGIVTIEDLLEEIFGEIVDEHDTEGTSEVQLPDGSWRVDGRTLLEDLAEILDRELEDEDHDTVGGLIFGTLGHVPRVGEQIVAHGLRFTVEGADPRRARRVRVEAVSRPEGSASRG